jgi:hypothetical protein
MEKITKTFFGLRMRTLISFLNYQKKIKIIIFILIQTT